MKKYFTIVLAMFQTTLLYGRDSVKLEGFYKSLGIGTGYYRYTEYNTANNDAFLMRIDTALLNIVGNLGYITNGFKVDLAVDANYSMGKYTGSILDTANPDKNGQAVTSFETNSFYHTSLKFGYNFLEPFEIKSLTLYLQSGIHYYFNRNDITPLERLQGYMSIPVQLEGEIIFTESWALNFMGGFNWFLFGHHLSRGTRVHFSGNLDTLQKEGFGANGYIGFTRLNDVGNAISIRLAYEYWSIGDSPSAALIDYVGQNVNLYEPKNSTHIIMLQYIWSF